MIEQDFILLIMNCKKYTKKALEQKKTWLKEIPSYLRFYHVIGDDNMEEKYHFDNENNVLYIKVEDDYNSLPKKVIRAYEAVLNTFQFNYIFKTDDDQMVIKPQFFDTISNLIQKMSPSPHYGGYIVDVKQPYLSQYYRIHPELPKELPVYKTRYCSGRFYFLSNEAVINLIDKREYIEKEYFEDYAIGFNLNDKLKINMLNVCTDIFFKDMKDI
jgi:hypothetical protein